jgi:hypothetical protein
MVPKAVQPIVERWQGFLGKIEARVGEVMAEGDAGFDEVMQIELIDPAVLSGASTAFSARLRGIVKKLEEAWEKIEGELEAVADEADDQAEAIYAVRERESERARELAFEIDLRGQVLVAKKEGEAARRLGELAQKEMAEPRSCTQCGGEIIVPEGQRHTAASVTCPYCRAVNAVPTGMATGMYYQGAAMHWLGHAAALDAWVALQHEERRYKDLREPTREALGRYRAATEAYWRRYVDEIARHDPTWDPATVEAQYRAKLGHFKKYVEEVDFPGG